MDYEILRAINTWATSNSGVSLTFFFFSKELLKNLLPVLLFWGLWFAYPEDQRRSVREQLVSLLLIGVVAIAAARLLANQLPHRPRPVHDPGVDIVVVDWIRPGVLEGWSAFPSDHAVLFFALAVGLFQISKTCGVVALVHAAIVVCLPRVATGLHWPSDILGGALVGIVISIVLFKLMRQLVHKLGIVPFFEAREAIGYPLLFLATYELSRMFHTVRQVTQMMLD